MFAIQRDGSADDDWTPYSGEKKVDLGAAYQKYELVFRMTGETDLKSVLSISMGAVDGVQITQKHRICIDNIVLEKTEAPVEPEVPAGENLLKNGDFSSGETDWTKAVTSPGEATITFAQNKVVINITNVGDQDWSVQLKQEGIKLEKGCTYRMKFKAKSTKARTIKCGLMNASYAWYGGKIQRRQ